MIDAVPRIKQHKLWKERMKMAKGVRRLIVSDEIPLDIWDPEKKTTVQFQQPRRLEQEDIEALQLSSEVTWNTQEQGLVRQRDRVPLSVLESRMVSYALVNSNLTDEDTGKPLFVPGKTCREQGKPLTAKIKDEFFKVWYDLPGELCDEIAQKLGEWYPLFDWRNPDRGEV